MTREIYTSNWKGIWSPYLNILTPNNIKILSTHINTEVSVCMQKPIRLYMEHKRHHYYFGGEFKKLRGNIISEK